MNILKKLLNPWVVALMIVTMVLSIVAHLYFGSCQTSKWHFILQSYYCPDWIEADVEFDVKKHMFWKEWHKNGQIKRSIKYKKFIVNYSYKFVDEKAKENLGISEMELFNAIRKYFNKKSLDPSLMEIVSIMDVYKENKSSLRNDWFTGCLNRSFKSPYFYTISSTLKDQILIFNLKLSDEKIYPYRHYSKGELEEIKRNSKVALEIKIHLTFEGEKGPEDSSEYPYQFECSYIEGPWTQYKENGDIDFVQTHNKRGDIIKVEYYKKGRVDKTYSAE